MIFNSTVQYQNPQNRKMRIVTVVPAPIHHLPVIPSVVPAGNSEKINRKNRI